MKKSLLLHVALLLSGVVAAADTRPREIAEAEQVIVRTFGRLPEQLRFVLARPDASGCDSYAVSVEEGRLCIEGTSCVALCRGFYDYILSQGYGVANWSGNRLELPDRLPDLQRRVTRSPFPHHPYMHAPPSPYPPPSRARARWAR